MPPSSRLASDTQQTARQVVKAIQSFRRAEEECRGFAADSAAMTSAFQIYTSALRNMDVPTHDFGDSVEAARAVFLAAKSAGRKRHNRVSQAAEADFHRRFPDAKRLSK